MRKSSAVCRLDWDETIVKWSIERFRAVETDRAQTIGRVAGNVPLFAAAFDGPLRQGLDMIGRFRTTERMLTRRLQPLIGKPAQSVTVMLPQSSLIGLQPRSLHRLRHPGTALAALALQGVQVADAPALNVREGSDGERIRCQQPIHS